ncbi:hypothetical protein D3C76_1274580 [compost metagenome]
MAQEQVFHLFGGDLLPAAVDLIFFAPLHGDIALLVNGDQIPRAVKAVRIKGAGVVFRALVVATEGVGPAGHQTPHLAARQRIAVLIGYPHFVIRAHRAALGIHDAFRGIIQRGVVHQPFGHAEHLLELAAHLCRNTGSQGGGESRSAHLQQLQRGQLGITNPFRDSL